MNDHIVRKIFFNTFLVQTMSVLASLISATVNGMVTGSLLGVTPMAAYGFVTPMINVYMALGGACGTGISTVCGRIVGEGDVKKIPGIYYRDNDKICLTAPAKIIENLDDLRIANLLNDIIYKGKVYF